MTDTTTDATTTTIDVYLSTWNEPDAAARTSRLAAAWVSDGHYVDPLQEATGYEQLSGLVDGVQAQFPGHRFERTTVVDRHHDRVRFGWALVAADGTVAIAGMDFGVLAADGRLQSITGFFGEVAPA
jgi:hypothetical protein